MGTFSLALAQSFPPWIKLFIGCFPHNLRHRLVEVYVAFARGRNAALLTCSLDSENDHGHLDDPGCWATKFNVVYIRINDFSVQLDAALGGSPRNEKHAREMHSV